MFGPQESVKLFPSYILDFEIWEVHYLGDDVADLLL